LLQTQGVETANLFPGGAASWALFILCTCAESLGRSSPYFQYGDWLKAKDTVSEVEQAIREQKEMSPKSLLDIYEFYLVRHGSRRALRNFFDKALDQSLRDKLASTVQVWRNAPPEFKLGGTGNSRYDDFINFLEKFRNSFAHDFESRFRIPTSAVLKELRDQFQLGDQHVGMPPVFTYQEVFSSGAFETIETSGLTEAMTEAVRAALWSWIVRHS